MPAAQPPPPNPTAHLQSLAADIGEVMEFYAARFGPVPIRTLEVAPVPGRFGQGFPGLIYLSTLSYMQPASLSAQQQMFFGDLLLSHEAAHQWWGNIVTSAGYHDDWVMEALANYSALMFLEKRKGARVMDAALENYRQELLAKGVDGKTAESAGPLVQGMRVGGSWSAILYGKGTWIVHMLRRKMGDDAFLKMLAGLRKNFEDKTISTDEFRVFCAGFLPAKSVDAKLESFFDQWVYGTGIPELKLEYKVTGKAPAWKVTGTVKQAGVDDDFTADVPVEIQAGRSKAGAVNVRASNEPVSFVASAKALPTKVVIDTHSILSK
jgi:aminopeptidase N